LVLPVQEKLTECVALDRLCEVFQKLHPSSGRSSFRTQTWMEKAPVEVLPAGVLLEKRCKARVVDFQEQRIDAASSKSRRYTAVARLGSNHLELVTKP
jgi:hypothetical protein